jgi:hypothetical protein
VGSTASTSRESNDKKKCRFCNEPQDSERDHRDIETGPAGSQELRHTTAYFKTGYRVMILQ